MSYAIGKSFLLRGIKVKAIAETDSGNVKVTLPNGDEEWTWHGSLCPIDGWTKNFVVFPIPQLLAAAA